MTDTKHLDKLPELTSELKAGLKFDFHSTNVTYYFILVIGLFVAAINILKVVEAGQFAVLPWALNVIYFGSSVVVGLLLWRAMVNRAARKNVIKEFIANGASLTFMQTLAHDIQAHSKSTKITVIKMLRLFTTFFAMLSANLAIWALADIAGKTNDKSITLEYVYSQLGLAGISFVFSLIFTWVLNRKYKKILA